MLNIDKKLPYNVEKEVKIDKNRLKVHKNS